MAEWVTCPGCDLKHRVRPDGACPRCAGRPGGVVAPPRAPGASFPAAARLAGGILLFFALVMPGRAALARRLFHEAGGVVLLLALADLLVGGALVLGARWSRSAGRIRALVGLVVAPLLYYEFAVLPISAIHLGLSVALLVLLVGTPATARFAVGAVAAWALVMGASVEYLATFFRIDLLRPLHSASREAPGPAVRSVEGRALAYRISTTAGEWRAMPARVHATRPDIDAWLRQPDTNAQVVVSLVRRRPELDSLEALVAHVLANIRSDVPDAELLEDGPLPNNGRLLRVRYRKNDRGLEAYYGVFLGEAHGVQVTALAFAEHLADVRPQLVAWATSFEPPAAP